MEKTFGERIKHIRKSRGLTQTEFAKELGYAHKGTIAHIEKDEVDMPLEKVLLVLRKFSVDANDLLGVKRIDELLDEQRRIKIERNSDLKDILVEINDIVLSYRVAGVLINGTNIMLTTKDNIHFTVPGGHVQVGETTRETIVREYKEETGLDVEVDKLMATYENFFKYNGKDVQQILMVYKVSLKNNEQKIKLNPDNERTKYKWLNLNEIDNYFLYPKGIIKVIKGDDTNTNHHIVKDI